MLAQKQLSGGLKASEVRLGGVLSPLAKAQQEYSERSLDLAAFP